MVGIFVFGLPLLTVGVMLMTKNHYTATGTLLVETPDGGIGSDLLGQLSAITGFTAQVPPTEMYLAILRSDRVAEAVIANRNLANHYEIEADNPGAVLEKTLLRLRKRTQFDSPDMISISLSARDNDPATAADIVNAFLDELDLASQTLALSRARRTRALVEEALADTDAELDSTRFRLQRFQEEHGVFSIEKQTEGTLELIAVLQGELLAKRTERDALDGYTHEQSGRIRSLDFEIDALETQIRKLLGKLPAANAGMTVEGTVKPVDSFFIPLKDLPGLAGEYARLFMDLKVQETKYSILATQLEQSKIEESQSIPSFEILDRARVPHRKSGPKRTLTVLAALVGGLMAGVLAAVLLDDIARRIDPEAKRELLAILPGVLRGPVGRLLPRG